DMNSACGNGARTMTLPGLTSRPLLRMTALQNAASQVSSLWRRRVLRKIALPDYMTQDLGDTSMLADPSVVDILKANHP
ncbi:unnamed protein product, partial [Polarella glacialis]